MFKLSFLRNVEIHELKCPQEIMYIFITPIITSLKENRFSLQCFIPTRLHICLWCCLALKPSGLWTSYFNSKYNLTVIVAISQWTAFRKQRPDNRITYAICERLASVCKKHKDSEQSTGFDYV